MGSTQDIVSSSEQESIKPTSMNEVRRGLTHLVIFFSGVVFLGLAWAFWWFYEGQYFLVTEDAYIHGNQNIITSQVAGMLTQVNMENAQRVKAGEVLAQLDSRNYEIDVRNQKSALANAVRSYYLLQESVWESQRQVSQSESEFRLAEQNLVMAKGLVGSGSISRQEYNTFLDAWKVKLEALNLAKERLAKSQLNAQAKDLREHPLVSSSIASYRLSRLNQIRCVIYSPIDGVLAKKSGYVGQQLGIGQSLGVVVDLKQIWVEANFKETYLGQIEPGMDVELRSAFNGKLYRGTVQAVAGGSGTAFSLLPAQNATGNWIKIVQRIPTRIVIDEESLIKNGEIPLGSSIQVKLDLRKSKRKIPQFEERISNFYTFTEKLLDDEVEEIIRRNIPQKTPKLPAKWP